MKTKRIYTRCRRKHRLFCKFESCKGNKLVTKKQSNMMYSEFVERTGMNVNSAEFSMLLLRFIIIAM